MRCVFYYCAATAILIKDLLALMVSGLPDAVNEELPAGLGGEPENAEHDLLLLQAVEVHRLEQLLRQSVKPVQSLFHLLPSGRIDEQVENRYGPVPKVGFFRPKHQSSRESWQVGGHVEHEVLQGQLRGPALKISYLWFII